MKYYIVDAFTDHVHGGNPAGVCIVDQDISAEQMQAIAAENNLAETAFLKKLEDGYQLRWFTPKFEIDLCGHATLATSYVVANYVDPQCEKMEYHTKSGLLTVERKRAAEGFDLYEMTFPTRIAKPVSLTKEELSLLNCQPLESYASRDLMLVLADEKEVADYVPDYNKLGQLKEYMGILITAKGSDCDFVSRFFCPEITMEDPVTGSSHCNLIPYWSERLGKKTLLSRQISKREGTLYCEYCAEHVKISGRAELYLEGRITG